MYHQFFRAISFFVSLLLVTHWVACFWVTIGCPQVMDSCVPTGWANFVGDIHSHTTFAPLGKYMCARHTVDMIVCLFVLCLQNYYICFQPAYMYIQSTYYMCVSLMLRVIIVWDGMQTRAGMKLQNISKLRRLSNLQRVKLTFKVL